LNSFIFESKTLNGNDLIAITRCMQVGAEADIELKGFCGQVDDGLVELVLFGLSGYVSYSNTMDTLQSSEYSR
jgi:hypothetical protein